MLQLQGIPNNLELCKAIASSEKFAAGRTTTGFLADFPFSPHAAEVVTPGMNTTVQVCPLPPYCTWR
jgi:urea carboxylase